MKIERKGQVLVGEGFAPYTYGGRGLHFWTVAGHHHSRRPGLGSSRNRPELGR
ncbi:MAG: hypothetical protein DDT18_01279 [Actinobacteria bacterium]|nr:hypothetical protein [Actinomycetota bacterium]